MSSASIKITLVAIAFIIGSALTKKVPTKTKVDIRVVRSPYAQHQPAYVLNPSYFAKADESQKEAENSGQQQQVSVISESQYEALLMQAQKALRGYDLSKLSATTKPSVEHTTSKPTEAVKQQYAIKYVYADSPTAQAAYSYNAPAPATATYTQAAYYNAPATATATYTHAHTPTATYTHTHTPAAYSKVEEEEHGYEHYSKHKFGYRVQDPHTGAAFGHSEVSEGHVTRGHYHVLLPDGRLQNVKYVADPSGYHATVTYESYKHY